MSHVIWRANSLRPDFGAISSDEVPNGIEVSIDLRAFVESMSHAELRRGAVGHAFLRCRWSRQYRPARKGEKERKRGAYPPCDPPALRCVPSADSGLKLIRPRVPARPRVRGRETISTSRSKAVRNDTRRSTEYSRKVPLNRRDTSGWLMPISSPAFAWVSFSLVRRYSSAIICALTKRVSASGKPRSAKTFSEGRRRIWS